MASASYLDSGDEMSGMTWGDFGPYVGSPRVSPFAYDPVLGNEWAGFDTNPMDVEDVALPTMLSTPLESAYSFNAVALARSGRGKVIEAQDEEVFVLSDTVKKRPREKSKASQRKKARKEEGTDSCCLRRAGANKKALSDFRAIRDSLSIRLTSDERELIGRYVVLLERSESQSKSGMDIMRMLRPLIRDLESFCDKTAKQLQSKLCLIRLEYDNGSRDLSKIKAFKDAREDELIEKYEQALSNYRVILDSKTTKLTSDEREFIRRYVALFEKTEHQRKSCTAIMRVLQPLLRDLDSFCDKTAEQLQSKLTSIRLEYNRGSRDLSKRKAREDARKKASKQALSDFRAIMASKSIKLTSDERELIGRYVSLLEKSENQRKSCIDIMKILQPLIEGFYSFRDRTAQQLQSKICFIRSEYKKEDRDFAKTKAR
jgi:hypothetical protein